MKTNSRVNLNACSKHKILFIAIIVVDGNWIQNYCQFRLISKSFLISSVFMKNVLMKKFANEVTCDTEALCLEFSH